MTRVRQHDKGWSIPTDWDGESWSCWSLAWPDSAEYKQLLMDLLYTLTRGREYDKTTGTIKDAQSAAWEIFDRNRPLAACSISGTPEVIEKTIEKICSMVIEGDEDMGQVVTDVTIEDGKLYVWFGPCCKREVGASGLSVVGGILEEPPEIDPANEEPPDPLTDISCDRAANMLAVFKQFCSDAYSQAFPLENLTIYSYASKLRELYRGFDLSNWSIYKLWWAVNAVVVAETALVDMIPDPSWSTLRCQWKSVLSNSSYNLTRAEYDAMKAKLPVIANIVYEPFIRTAFDALNFSSFSLMSRDAAHLSQTVGTCDCPTAPAYGDFNPDDYEWYSVYDFSVDEQGFSAPAGSGTYDAVDGWWEGTDTWTNNGSLLNINNGVAEATRTGYVQFVKLFYNIKNGDVLTPNSTYVRLEYSNGAAAATAFLEKGDIDANAGTGEAVWTGNRYYTYTAANGSIKFRCQLGAYGTDVGDRKIEVYKIIIAGVGDKIVADPPIA